MFELIRRNNNHINAYNPFRDLEEFENSFFANPFGGFTQICAKSLKYADLISALEQGSFYASEGPIIKELYTEDGRLCVESETPLSAIRMLSGNRYVEMVRNADRTPVTEGKFKLEKGSGYMRLELIGLDGRRAYTNAYFCDSLI